MPRVYDDAQNHRADLPAELPRKATAIPLGMFFAWCAARGLASGWHGEYHASTYEALAAGSAGGRDYLLQRMDGRLTEEHLTPTGQAFAAHYLEGGRYLADFDEVLAGGRPSRYHVEDTPENQALLSAALDGVFAAWCAESGTLPAPIAALPSPEEPHVSDATVEPTTPAAYDWDPASPPEAERDYGWKREPAKEAERDYGWEREAGKEGERDYGWERAAGKEAERDYDWDTKAEAESPSKYDWSPPETAEPPSDYKWQPSSEAHAHSEHAADVPSPEAPRPDPEPATESEVEPAEHGWEPEHAGEPEVAEQPDAPEDSEGAAWPTDEGSRWKVEVETPRDTPVDPPWQRREAAPPPLPPEPGPVQTNRPRPKPSAQPKTGMRLIWGIAVLMMLYGCTNCAKRKARMGNDPWGRLPMQEPPAERR